MKMLIVGAWQWPQYEAAFSAGLQENGVQIENFELGPSFSGLAGKYQRTVPIPGPIMLRINQQLVDQVSSSRPDVVLFWRPTHIFPSSVSKISNWGIKTVSYNNDDHFGPKVHKLAP